MKEKIYYWYVRKSTDVEDKQVNSLEDQVTFIEKKAEFMWIKIKKIYSESQSAKAPWRIEFNKMIQEINRWWVSGIVSWKIYRITRNPIDTGTIQYMLQNSTLENIITNDREYNKGNSGLIFSVETGMSNQFLLDLKKNVKRWMDSKIEKWVFCWKAPEWYLNNRVEKTIEVDEWRFEIVRKMWDLMLTWDYSVPKLTKVVANDFGFRRKKRQKSWWNPIAISGMYKLLTNPFYMWYFNWNSEVIKWTHKAMISYDEFNRVQKLLWEKGRTVDSRTHHFSYTWCMKCGECGASITATEFIKKGRHYVYYHCTKSSKIIKCSQKYTSLRRLEDNILEIIDAISIPQEYLDWGFKNLDKQNREDIEINKVIKRNLKNTLKELKSEQERALNLCIKWVISENLYISKKEKIDEELNITEDKLENFWDELERSLDITQRYMSFLANVKEKFINWDLDTKKKVLLCFWDNLILHNSKLEVIFHPWIEIIKKDQSNIWDINNWSWKASFDSISSLPSPNFDEKWYWYSHGELNSDLSLEKAAS